MKTNIILQGDALTKLKELPDESINCVMTSPPYWALRDYGVEGQLGLEPTFDLYIKHLCDIFDEVKRVLRKDGTCWVNLGDTYGNGGTSNNKGFNDRYRRKEINYNKTQKQEQGRITKAISTRLPTKCLVMIPFRFAIEMVNRGWILRNNIIWHKRNCMPSSVKDRFTVDFEYLFFFVKNKKYFFETQYEPIAESTKNDKRLDKGLVPHKSGKSNMENSQYAISGMCANSIGRNKRTVWTINPKPFKESHFAVYPEELCETPIKAGCPEFVCNKCGNPKILDVEYQREQTRPAKESKYSDDVYVNSNRPMGLAKRIMSKQISKGYKPTCKCNEGFTEGIVLDPFFGAGTTGLVALKQNKKFIGIELNPEYIKIANKRLKPYLEQTKLNLK